MRRFLAMLVAAIAIALGSMWFIDQVRAGDGCHPIAVTPDTPTGIAGCAVYGEGTASSWGGPGVARNDCLYPWTGCQLIAIQSLQTGLTIIVRPRMFGDLYTGTSQQRIVDLDPAALRALGLRQSDGLWPVRVWAVDAHTGFSLPDTATTR